MMGVEFEEIQRLNPEVLRCLPPPNIAEYKLRLPPNTATKLPSVCAKADLVANNFQQFVVTKKAMTLETSF